MNETEKAFYEIIGYDDIKRQLLEIADIMNNREVYAKFNVSVPRGILFTGEPGLGKTLMATCLIHAAPGWNKYVLRKTKANVDFVDEIKETFEAAKNNTPAVILLDDLDKYANGDYDHLDCDEYVTVQACIDSAKKKDVMVIATVNNKRKLPYALLRSGRFDRHISVDAPSAEDAQKIVISYLKKCKNVADDIDTELVARLLIGQSCAVLETIINEGGICAGFDRSDKLRMKHIFDAILKIVYKIPSKDAVVDDEMIRCAYHEAGHVALDECFKSGSVTLSTVLRNNNSGGVTVRNRSTKCFTYEDVETSVCVLLGSRAAMEYKYGEADLGCSNDLETAFEIIRRNITENAVRGLSLQSTSGEYEPDSNEYRLRMETVCYAEIERLYLKTKKLLFQNSDFLEKVANALIEKKVITYKDISEIKAELITVKSVV